MTNVIDPIVCAGKSCKNLGTVYMAIKYINKTGIFCEVCSTELLRQELAVKLDCKVNKKIVHEENRYPNHTSFQNPSFQKCCDLSRNERNHVCLTTSNS